VVVRVRAALFRRFMAPWGPHTSRRISPGAERRPIVDFPVSRLPPRSTSWLISTPPGSPAGSGFSCASRQPVQVGWFNNHGTRSIATLDCAIADEAILPPGWGAPTPHGSFASVVPISPSASPIESAGRLLRLAPARDARLQLPRAAMQIHRPGVRLCASPPRRPGRHPA
jgi:hypothetical protein